MLMREDKCIFRPIIHHYLELPNNLLSSSRFNVLKNLIQQALLTPLSYKPQ
ncbi:hypothetical protein HMPREF0973_00832 [Prevotella veroralis F0319]|uniref:Uncharacterized protein n=1 Tax=Prevotella veroralis F0319 TaxID=649761 RepID=C9MMK0_9BACT|nr:hypothetical protein HMPREF0973_00832 [Prevotella veroralis F0319]